MSFIQIVLIFMFLATTLGLTMLQGWRRLTIALAVQYMGVFVALVLIWPVGMAAMKLIAGWMSTAILVTNQPVDIKAVSQSKWNLIFKGLVFVFIWLVVFATGAILSKITSIPQPFILMGMILLWGGLIQLGMSREPVRIIIGLLTVLSGFEIIYSYVEPSLLVAGLLAAVTLGLAFIGSYLFSVPDMEERE